MTYTKVAKPTGTSYTKIGLFDPFFDDPTVLFDDISIYFDGGINSYTKIAKPSTSSYTKVSKPT